MNLEISQGLRIDNLEDLQGKVRLRGGRLIVYSEVISAFFISARNYRVRWIAPHGDRFASGLLSTFISGILGWWSIAGPSWTLTAIIWNCRGGYDVTDSLLNANPESFSPLSYSEGLAIDELYESARSLSIKVCWVIAVIIMGFVGYMFWRVNTN